MTGKLLAGTVSAEEEVPGALAAECPRQCVKTELLSEPGKAPRWRDLLVGVFFFLSAFESRWRNHFALTL